MKLKNSLYVLSIITLSVLVILFLESFITDFFIVPFLESIVIFLAILLLLKTSNESLGSITFMSAVFFFILETIVYLICSYLGLIDKMTYDVLSWRLVYGLFFTMLWIPISVYGLKYKDKIFWFFFLFLGCLMHLGINLIMSSF